jgi:hypothetical protein
MEVECVSDLPGSDLSFPATNVFGAHDFLNPLETVGTRGTFVSALWQEDCPDEVFVCV